MISWDIYELNANKTKLHHVRCRRRIRNFGVKNNFDVLSENAVDKENVVRFAILQDSGIDLLKNFLLEEFENIQIEKIASGLLNPVLSKWKINNGKS